MSYNNGQWHHVVATLGTVGMSLYVNGTVDEVAIYSRALRGRFAPFGWVGILSLANC
jgi:hypothetical protein